MRKAPLNRVLKPWSHFWKLKALSQPGILMKIESQLHPIHTRLPSILKGNYFAGVLLIDHCKLNRGDDMMAKKNTEVWRLSVLSATCCRLELCIDPIVASRINVFNIFAVIHD